MKIFPRYFLSSAAQFLFFLPSATPYRNTIMAAASGGSDTQRARSRRPFPADIPRHHRIEATHRHRRQQRRYLSHSVESLHCLAFFSAPREMRDKPAKIQFLTAIKINFELK